MALGLDSFSYHLHFGKHYWAPQASPPRDVFWFLDRAHSLGFDGVQIDPLHIGSFEEEHIRRIRREAEERGLFIELGTGGYEGEKIRSGLRRAEQLGARALRTFLGGERVGAEEREKILAAATGGLRQAAPLAEELGIPIAVENHEDLLAEELLDLLGRVEHEMVGVCLDTGNSVAVGEDPLHCVRLLAAHAKSVHLKDGRPLRSESGEVIGLEGLGLGDGELDVQESVRIIRSSQPDLPITLEIPCRPRGDEAETLAWEDECVRRSVQFARQVLGL